MFNSANIANRMQNDMAKIQLDTTVDYAAIQTDIIKKMGKFKGACGNQPVQYATAPMQYIPPAAYQSQYCTNYGWQQPNVQNAYATVQNYTPTMASFDSSQVQAGSYMPQAMAQNTAVQGGAMQSGAAYAPNVTAGVTTQGQTAENMQVQPQANGAASLNPADSQAF